MAYTFDGMAAADFDTAVGAKPYAFPKPLAHTPFLVKKITVVADGTDAEQVLHGETAFPDIVFCNKSITNPHADGTVAAYPGSTAAYVAVDVGAAGTFDVYMIWFEQAAGGIS